MLIRTSFFSKVLGICALLGAQQAAALCIGVSQPLLWDTNFQPLVLKFSLHATNRLDGFNIVPADQTFIEEVRLDKAILPAYDHCNQNTYVSGQAEVGVSELTADIAGHFGTALSLASATFSLEQSSAGYSGGPISVPQFSARFSLSVSGPDSIWSSSLGQELRLNHSKSISLGGISGEYLQDLNVLAFLQARIGTTGNFSMVGSTSTSSYVPVDPQYGYFGNATLLSVTAVPVPGAAWLFGSALLAFAAVARRKTVS